MLRPNLVFSGIGVALCLCSCTLNTTGLGPDVGRGPGKTDTGVVGGSGGAVVTGAGGSGGSAGATGGSGGDATGGSGPGGSGGDATGGSAGDDASVIDPDAGEADAASGGSGGSGGASGSGGTGGVVIVVDAAPPQEMRIVSAIGCADGTREGFLSLNRYPGIAACSGGWTEPGLSTTASMVPQCENRGGNSGPYPNGGTCSAADLCAVGWHVCESANEAERHSDDCDDAVEPANGSPIFFATRQPSATSGCSSNMGDSNIIGCGNIGGQPSSGCGPLNARLDNEDCARYRPWLCGDDEMSVSTELRLVTKPGSTRGGVLCCRS